jgi:hypothetical protein
MQHVDDGFSTVELLEHRLVDGIAEPFVAVVGRQVDAVRLDDIEGARPP